MSDPTPDPKPADPAPDPKPDPPPDPKPDPKPDPDPTLGPDGKPWDPERAGQTIAKLREIEAQAKKDSKALADSQAELKKLQDAQLSDEERKTKEFEELKASDAETRRQLRDKDLRLAVYELAPTLEIGDPGLAVAALDRSAVEYDDAGQPTNLDDVLAKTLEKHPALKADTGNRPPPKTDATSKSTGTTPDLTAEELDMAQKTGMTPERYAAMKETATVDDYERLREQEREKTKQT